MLRRIAPWRVSVTLPRTAAALRSLSPALSWRAMETPRRPEDALGRELPDLTLTDANGRPFGLRSRVGQGPLVLFFYIHNGTPG